MGHDEIRYKDPQLMGWVAVAIKAVNAALEHRPGQVDRELLQEALDRLEVVLLTPAEPRSGGGNHG